MKYFQNVIKDKIMSTYILQKDLPNMKAGKEFMWDEKNKLYRPADSPPSITVTFFDNFYVEANPEWFKKKQEISDAIKSQKPITNIVLHLGNLSKENKDKLEAAQLNGLFDDWRYGIDFSIL